MKNKLLLQNQVSQERRSQNESQSNQKLYRFTEHKIGYLTKITMQVLWEQCKYLTISRCNVFTILNILNILFRLSRPFIKIYLFFNFQQQGMLNLPQKMQYTLAEHDWRAKNSTLIWERGIRYNWVHFIISLNFSFSSKSWVCITTNDWIILEQSVTTSRPDIILAKYQC